MNGKLDRIQREKDELQREKRDLESQLVSAKDEVRERDRYKYDLGPDEWKELAAQERIKYRMPCLMPLESSWKMSPAELDKLGLTQRMVKPWPRPSGGLITESGRPCVHYV